MSLSMLTYDSNYIFANIGDSDKLKEIQDMLALMSEPTTHTKAKPLTALEKKELLLARNVLSDSITKVNTTRANVSSIKLELDADAEFIEFTKPVHSGRSYKERMQFNFEVPTLAPKKCMNWAYGFTNVIQKPQLFKFTEA